MSDEPDEIDLDGWPDALDPYRQAYELARRAVAEADHCKHGDPDPGRELATLKKRLGIRGLDPGAEARVRVAMEWGEADGTASGCGGAGDGPGAGMPPRRRESSTGAGLAEQIGDDGAGSGARPRVRPGPRAVAYGRSRLRTRPGC